MTLKEWLTANRYTYPAFVGLLEKEGVKVTPQAVQKWTLGHEPRRAARDAIRKITGGKVKPDSFVRQSAD